MKHSASGSMTESYEAKVVIPCEGRSESVLQKLCVDLCDLIVESRTPGINDRGYGDGVHCPPLLGRSKHVCDNSKPECQKHQIIIHHLMQAVATNIFVIEVLLLPECCRDPKLKEKIQSKEYILMERWSMNFICGKTEHNIEVPQLLRAVRSFLHFSQISAWLSSTNGKSPANICYWVNAKFGSLCTTFKQEREVHSFPICKINEDLYGSVKVEFPTRTQYIPIIPCSKHPPLCGYSLRAINEKPDLCKNIPLETQIVNQLHKTCDTEQADLTAINCVSETKTIMIDPASLLKTFSTIVPDGSKANRVLKHSNLQENILSSSSLPLDITGKTIDMIPKKQSTYVCNYAETMSSGYSQENICCDKRQLGRHLHKTEFKFRKIKKITSTPHISESFASFLSSSAYNLNQNTVKLAVNGNGVSQVSNLFHSVTSSDSLLKCMQSSPLSLEKCSLPSSQTLYRQLTKRTKSVKRKYIGVKAETLCMLPHKRFCDMNFSSQMLSSPPLLNCMTPWLQRTATSQKQINNLRTDNVLQENCICSAAVAHSCNNNIKVANEKNQHCFNFSFPFQGTSKILTNIQIHDCVKTINLQTGTNIQESSLKTKVLNKNENATWCNSDVKLSKRICNSQLDTVINVRKKVKLLNECKDTLNLCDDSSCIISKLHVDKMKPNKSLVPKSVNKQTSLKEYYSKRNSLKKRIFCTNSVSWSKSNLLNDDSFNESKRKSCIKKLLNLSNNGSNSFSEIEYSQNNNLDKTKTFALNSPVKNFELESMQQKFKNSYNPEAELQRYDISYIFSDIKVLSKSKPKDLSIISDYDSNASISQLVSPPFKNAINISRGPEEESSMETSDARLFKKTKHKTACKKKPKSVRKKILKEKTLCPTMITNSKLNTLFKTKKFYQSDYCQNKNDTKRNQTCLKINIESASHYSEKCKPLSSFTDCQDILNLTNLSEETITRNSTSSIDKISKDRNSSTFDISLNFNSKLISQRKHQSFNYPVSTFPRNLCPVTDGNLECFPKRTAKFPKGKMLSINFEESILKGRFPIVKNVNGFHAEIGASGSFCPNHLTLPADVSFYELGDSHQGAAPYVAHVTLGNSEYCLPKKGAVQVTLFNPTETVVKMFVLNYDLSSMPPLCHTFMRQKIYYLPVGQKNEHPTSQKWLRFIIHLRFASSKTGRISLYKDFKIVVLNKSNEDAASEFSQEPRELCSFVSVPKNPTFSNI